MSEQARRRPGQWRAALQMLDERRAAESLANQRSLAKARALLSLLSPAQPPTGEGQG